MVIKKAPLSQFAIWEDNPRNTIDAEELARLEASLSSRKDGTINMHQNLIAVPHKGMLITIGGNRRLTALKNLAAAGEIAPDTELEYKEENIDINDHEAIRIALEENTLRVQMDKIDECIAYYRLAAGGKTPADIALIFGITEKTVRQNIAIGGLPADALTLIRSGERTLTWGKALTSADHATRAKILSEIAVSPTTWKTDDEIRRHLHRETIPASHALFDESLYMGPILRDLFEGNRFQDRDEFWEHQNVAVENLKGNLEKDGWARVVISHTPVDSWKYGKSDVKSEAMVIIEVSPNGQVTRYDGLVDHNFDEVGEHDVIEADEDEHGDQVAQGAVKISAGALEFARTVKSTIIQSVVAEDHRKATEIVVAGLLGHAESPFRMLPVKLKGDQKLRVGAVFDKVTKNAHEVTKAMTAATDVAQTEAFIAGLSDEALNSLFARLVATRVAVPTSGFKGELLSKIGLSTGNIRDHWTPTETFLSGLPTEELRNTAISLLPGSKQKGLLAARKTHLVEALLAIFDEARTHSPTLDRETAERINAWSPSWMRFVEPAAALAEENGFFATFGDALAEAEPVAETADQVAA